uniref:VWFD domain-containing protein n=1 Tax=Leptobrachium leishanense TaxID=445787 RepID=A0A8C5P9A2_9ANUR
DCKNNQVLQYRAASCYRTCATVPEAENCDDQTLLFEDCGCPDGQYLNTEQVCVPKLDCDCHTDYGVLAAHESKKIAEKCKGGAEFIDCSYPKSHRRDDLWCNTTHLPKLHVRCYCPISMVKNSKGECILPSECPCYFGGEEFENGRTVINSCNKCFCNKGVWKCTNKKCSSTCHIHGDGHFRTFDDMSFSFDGLCQYTVVEDYCNSDKGTFRILAQSVPCCDNELTCARKIIVIYKDLSITFQDGKANIENAKALDCSRKPSTVLYSINTVGLYKILELPDGIRLVWDGLTRLSITLDPHWNGKVCGLCGNNNGNLKDELKTRAGSVVVETLAFANNWKVDPDCKNTEEQIFPCDANPHCKPWAERKCNILREGKFKECHHKVDPTLYYKACIEEACVCDMEGKYSGYCTTIAMYAEACNIAGVCVNWREPNLCPVFCDYFNELGGGDWWHYNPCGSTNIKTCNNQESSHVFSSPIEGCYANCSDAKPYLDQNTMKCVSFSECSCSYNGYTYAGGSFHLAVRESMSAFNIPCLEAEPSRSPYISVYV